MTDCNCVEREAQENKDLYGEDNMIGFPNLIAEVINHLVGLGFTLNAVHCFDTMASITFDLRDERRCYIHFHPNKKLSTCESFKRISVDPEQSTDEFHKNCIALDLHRKLGLDISRL